MSMRRENSSDNPVLHRMRLAGSVSGTHIARISAWEYALALLYPLTQLVEVNVGGTFYGQDAAAILLLPILARGRSSTGLLRRASFFFAQIALWLLGQIITDLVRGTPFADYSRGWSKIVFFSLQFAVLWLLLSRSPRLVAVYGLGLGVAYVLRAYTLSGAEAEYPWKFGLGAGIAMIGASGGDLLSRRGRALVLAPVALVAAAGLLALYHDARSTFGIAALCAGYVFVLARVFSKDQRKEPMNPARFAMLAFLGVVFCHLAILGYSTLALNGDLGEAAKRKYEDQARGDINIIQAGRVESLVSTVAIADSPVLGHGSWARNVGYVRLLAKKRAELGIPDVSGSEGYSDLIPSHSHILGAWVEAGIAGAIFWAWVLILCAGALYRVHFLPATAHATIVFSAFTLLWDVMFSPFGADQRFIRAFQIALMLQTFTRGRVAARLRELHRRGHTRGSLIMALRVPRSR